MQIYRFITNDDDAQFCKRVSKALTEGWQLHGEPKYVFDASENKMRCGQAVTKQVPDQPFDMEKPLTDY
jgi:hypothetical protein